MTTTCKPDQLDNENSRRRLGKSRTIRRRITENGPKHMRFAPAHLTGLPTADE